MSEVWAERQRRTNELTRLMAAHVFGGPQVSPRQLYGLCELAWITKAPLEGIDSPTRKLKISALEDILGQDYSNQDIREVAKDISQKIRQPSAEKSVVAETGFTNFYRVYRNSAYSWLETNFNEVRSILNDGFDLESDSNGRRLCERIEHLPKIPKPNHPDGGMRPEALLTPALFSLDKRLRFPLINGAASVKNLLSKIDASDATLSRQYSALISLYGKNGIRDAADLDQIGWNLDQFIRIDDRPATDQLLQEKPTDENELPIKDEADIEAIKKAGKLTYRRLHNKLTNTLKRYLDLWTLTEGASDRAMFDVRVLNFEEDKDLLIEVKSSSEAGQIRMAIGQLYDYEFDLSDQISDSLSFCRKHLASASRIYCIL